MQASKQASKQASATDFSHHESLYTPKILCVEDEEMIREDIVEELKDFGFETIEASSGEDGLKAIKENSPDLVLCDISMGEMSGLDLLSVVRKEHPELADMPFVFLTALAEHQDILTGRLLGGDDYLTKPIDYELLYATIQGHLEQVRRMEERKQKQFSELRENLLRIFPHELLTPLNHILGYCDLLEFSLTNENENSTYVEYVDIIKQGGVHLLNLVKGVLNLVEATSVGFSSTRGLCLTAEVINESVFEFALKIKKKELELSVEVPEFLPPIIAEKKLVAQVITALLSNAVKFTPSKGKVGIKAVYDEQEDFIEISITDSGIGMSEQEIPLALEAFSQLDRRLEREFDGFGIGLTVANTLIRVLGGTLEISSKTGEFTTVTFRLPSDNNVFLV